MFQFTQTVQLVSEAGSQPGEEGRAPMQARVSNAQVAEVLFNIATLLELQQANPYRIAAYRNAARGMLTLPEPAVDVLARGARLAFPGLGDRLRAKIGELITTGRMTFYNDLCEESLPDEVRALMAVPHVGPHIALRLVGTLGVRTVGQLAEAAVAHKLREHYGFGERSERRLAEGARAVLEAQREAARQAERFVALGALPSDGPGDEAARADPPAQAVA